MPKSMTLRLDDEQAAELDAIARIENVPVAEEVRRALAAPDAAVGVDVGLDHLLTLSIGEKVANPRHERRDRTRLAKSQRELARKAKGEGANRRKARARVAKIHARIEGTAMAAEALGL